MCMGVSTYTLGVSCFRGLRMQTYAIMTVWNNLLDTYLDSFPMVGNADENEL